MVEALPDSVRYVKNGAGGQWWNAAKDNGQIHAGWRSIPDALLRTADMGQIESLIRSAFGTKPGAMQDFNALRTLLVEPSQHVWVTFQSGCMCGARFGMELKQTPTSKRASEAIFGLPVNRHGATIPWTISGI